MRGKRSVLVVDGLELQLDPTSSTGYSGVILVKNKYYQARIWDKVRKKVRALPGLHRTAQEAARVLAEAKSMLASDPDLIIPNSPKKRKPRLASPLTPPAAAAQPAIALAEPIDSKGAPASPL